MNQYAKNLIAHRIKKGLTESNKTQTELANMINKSRAYVTNITQGRYTPKVWELLRIAEFLNKPVGYFFGEDIRGLMTYVDKAKKWDKIVSLIEKDIQTDFNEDILAIPFIDVTKIQKKSMNDIIELKNRTDRYIYLSKKYLKNTIKFFKSTDKLIAVQVFIRDYPEFGLDIGDILIGEFIQNNEIGDENSGKLFTVFYKNEIGVKRIYIDGNEYYFEPMHSNPQIEKVRKTDPNLLIPGIVRFSLSAKIF